VAPLRLGGLRGKQSTPSVGWEVPVRSRRSASGSGTERADRRSRRHSKRAIRQFKSSFLLFHENQFSNSVCIFFSGQ
jgi:hypothetical protein